MVDSTLKCFSFMHLVFLLICKYETQHFFPFSKFPTLKIFRVANKPFFQNQKIDSRLIEKMYWIPQFFVVSYQFRIVFTTRIFPSHEKMLPCNLATGKGPFINYVVSKQAILTPSPEIYIQSALNNSNETYIFICLGRAGRFGQC